MVWPFYKKESEGEKILRAFKDLEGMQKSGECLSKECDYREFVPAMQLPSNITYMGELSTIIPSFYICKKNQDPRKCETNAAEYGKLFKMVLTGNIVTDVPKGFVPEVIISE